MFGMTHCLGEGGPAQCYSAHYLGATGRAYAASFVVSEATAMRSGVPRTIFIFFQS